MNRPLTSRETLALLEIIGWGAVWVGLFAWLA